MNSSSYNIQHKAIADAFAIENGFDGAFPINYPAPDGYESYIAGCSSPSSEWGLRPLMDNCVHMIFANSKQARWRSEDDAINLVA